MPLPPIVLRSVKGTPLTKEEQEGNIVNLDTRVTAIEENPPEAVGIDHFEVVGSQFYVHMTDDTELGPYDLPAATWNPRGPFLPDTTYLKFDLFTVGAAAYVVDIAHTSGEAFDENAGNSEGDFYTKVFEFDAFAPPVVTSADTALSTIAAHANKYVRLTAASEVTVTILTDETENLAVGTEIRYRVSGGGGSVVFVPEDDSTDPSPSINWQDDTRDLAASVEGAVVVLKKIGANAWDVFGDLDEIEMAPITVDEDAVSSVIEHANRMVRLDAETSTTVTILTDAIADHAVGTRIRYRLNRSGVTVTFVPEDDGTSPSPIINYPDEICALTCSTKGGVVEFEKVGDDEWDCYGLLDLIGTA